MADNLVKARAVRAEKLKANKPAAKKAAKKKDRKNGFQIWLVKGFWGQGCTRFGCPFLYGALIMRLVRELAFVPGSYVYCSLALYVNIVKLLMTYSG
ncbi:MAG: hypothetical protein VB050_03780 [Geobacteraceae bacterium]|nr:hypothetical protein [Geobacteraceae bacterium]